MSKVEIPMATRLSWSLLLALFSSILVLPASPAQAHSAPAVDAKIEIVWPHDQQGNATPVGTAPLVNIEVYLFQRITRTVDGKTFPVWIFNNVPIGISAGVPYITNIKTFYVVAVEGADYRTNVWAHGADARTYFPQRDVPASTGAGCA
jgi:hypothetical protein